jgi:hypothetical protein
LCGRNLQTDLHDSAFSVGAEAAGQDDCQDDIRSNSLTSALADDPAVAVFGSMAAQHLEAAIHGPEARTTLEGRSRSITILSLRLSLAMIACAWAQQPAKLPKVAILSPRAPTAHACAANLQAAALPCVKAAVRELGFVDVKSCFASNVAVVILFGEIA